MCNNDEDEWAPIIRGAKSATSSKTSMAPSTFKLKVTIPEPFKMTLRDEMRFVRNKNRFAERSETTESVVECLKQFRARPIPANTFLPLYDKITKEKEANRRKAREQHMARIMSEVQPFTFEERNEATRRSSCRRRSMSVPNMLDDDEELENLPVAPITMVAAAPPPPPHLDLNLTPKRRSKKTLGEMMEEKELFRECRIKTRAEKLLKMSSLPESMAQRQEQLQKTPKHSHNHDAKPTPKTTTLYQRTSLQKRPATSSSSEKVATSVTRPSSFNRALPSAKKVKEDQRHIGASRRRSKTISDFDDLEFIEMFPPPKMTLAALLRESVNRKRSQDEKEVKEKKDRSAFRKGKDELELKQRVVSKSRSFQSLRKGETVEDKQKSFRDAEKARLQEYHQEIRMMAERLRTRPLLMEQQTQLSAVRKVDKRFREKLCQEGLDEEMLLKYSQKVASSRTQSTSSYTSAESNNNEDDDESRVVSGNESVERDHVYSDTSGNEAEEDEYSTFSEKTLQNEDIEQ